MKKSDRILNNITIGLGCIGAVLVYQTIGSLPFLGIVLLTWAMNSTMGRTK